MSHSRRDFLMHGAALGGAVALAANASKAEQGPETRPRNVVLLLTDDHGPELGCYNTPGVSTPHIDALASGGMRFRQAYATSASCSPSRSALLTGMYPHSNGHWRNTHAPGLAEPGKEFTRETRFAEIEKVGVHEDIPTLVELLNSQGVVTGITEKFHLSPAWKYNFAKRLAVPAVPKHMGPAVSGFLEDVGERPFFLMANVGNTHRPFDSHMPDIGRPPVRPDEVRVPPQYPDTPAMREDYAKYLTTVQCADATVGVVMEALRASGKLEDTLIIFTGDQGPCFHRAKATGYDAGLRVPFIASGPGVRRGISNALVSHTDVAPTILAHLGLPIPGNVQGRNLWPLLRGEKAAPWRSHVFGEHNAHGPGPTEWFPTRTVFDGRFHYIHHLNHEVRYGKPLEAILDTGFTAEIAWAGPADAFPGGAWGNASFAATVEAKEAFPKQYDLLKQTLARDEVELYDLHTDPGEMHNLAGDPAFAGVAKRLRGILDAWREETGDPGMDLIATPRRE